MLRWLSGSKKGFLVGFWQVGKREQGRLNPGETCLPVYSGELVLRKISVFLGPWALGCQRCVKSWRWDARAQIYDVLLARMLTHVVVYVCELDKRSV